MVPLTVLRGTAAFVETLADCPTVEVCLVAGSESVSPLKSLSWVVWSQLGYRFLMWAQ